MSWDFGEDIICGARFHSVECIALLSSKKPRKAAMDSKGIRRLYLLLRPKGRLSPGRKTPPGVSAPSTGLRPLIVSRVKCGGRPYRGHSVIPYVFFELSIPLRIPKSANGPRSNSFRPDSPFATTCNPGTEDSVSPSPHRPRTVTGASSILNNYSHSVWKCPSLSQRI